MPELSPLASPAERRAHVARLRAVVASGTYAVASDDVAAAVLADLGLADPGRLTEPLVRAENGAQDDAEGRPLEAKPDRGRGPSAR